MWIYKSKKEIPRKAFLLISVSLCLANARVFELLSLRTQRILLAFFFYIDGVYTIIDMATTYGSALGLNSTGLLLALLVTQIVAFPFAVLFGRLAQKYKTEKLIMICIEVTPKS